MTIKIGKVYVFNYPDAFTTLPDHTLHAGQCVQVVRELGDDEVDPENRPMFEIKAGDGWVGQAHEEELGPLQLSPAWVDSGFCRVYYRDHRRRLYCWQLDRREPLTLLLFTCTNDGEPDCPVHKSLVVETEPPKGDEEIERQLREFLASRTGPQGLPVFRVCVQQYVEETAVVEVEAIDLDAAMAEAKRRLDAGEVENWAPGDDTTGREIYAVFDHRGDDLWSR